MNRGFAKHLAKYLAIFIFCLVIVYYAFSYIILDTLSVYDASGHLLAVHNAKDFWPNWHGWSSDMLGWSQGSTYPPAVHWVMAGLAKVFGDVVAIKSVVVLAIFLLPFAIWQYLKTINYSKVGGFVLFIFLFMILIVTPDYFGSSIKSLFNLGLITNFVALPFLFLYLTFIERLNADGGIRNILLSGLLLALLVWSHLVIAAVGLLYLFSMMVTKITAKFKFKDLVPFLKSSIFAAILCLPFAIQAFLCKNQATNGSGIASLLMPNIITSILSLLFILNAYRKKELALCRILILSFILALICSMDAVLNAIFHSSFFVGELHVYRFQVFAYVFFVIAASDIVVFNLNNIFKKQETMFWLVPVLLLVILAVVESPFKFDYAKVSVNNSNNTNGRFLELFSRKDSYPSPYTFQSLLSISNEKAKWGSGLFIESAPNAPFIKSLSKSLSSEPNSILKMDPQVEEVLIPVERQADALRLFAIENVVSLNNSSSLSDGEWSRDGSKKYYHMNYLGSQSLFEIPELRLAPVVNDWKGAISDWWRGAGKMTTLPYDASIGLIETGDYSASAKIKSREINDNELSFYVDSDAIVPVLVKVTYSNEWRAYNNGQSIKVWKAAPYLMLVQAKGLVTLKR